MNLTIELFIYYFSSLYLLILTRIGLIYNELEMAVKYIPVFLLVGYLYEYKFLWLYIY